MPRRRRRNDAAAEIFEDVAETFVDTVIDRAGDAWSTWRERQKQALPEEVLRQEFTCAACRKSIRVEQLEMLHPTNGYALCRGCFKFLWDAGKEKIATFSRRAAQQQAHAGPQQGAAPGQPSPKGRPPWEVLGVGQNASMDEIKRAYRKLAMLWHPDRVPAQASADERMHAKAMFDEVQRAFNVMKKVRQAPEAP